MLTMEDVARHCNEIHGDCGNCVFCDEEAAKKGSLVPCRLEAGKGAKKKPMFIVRGKPAGGGMFTEDEIYDLCDYLAKIIYPALVAFERYSGGIPAPLLGEDNEATDKNEHEWHEILKKMIWSFDQYLRDEPDEPRGHGAGLASEENKAYHARVQEGFDLFGKILSLAVALKRRLS